MSLNSPPSITEQANRIATWLRKWAEPRGGTVKVMANLRHLWEEVLNMGNFSMPRILICFNSERTRGGGTEGYKLHRVDREWVIVVMRGHGFKNLMSDTEGNFATDPQLEPKKEDFYSSVESIRDNLRIMLNISEEFPFEFKSIGPLPGVGPNPQANAVLDAYEIRMNSANDIPEVFLQDPKS